MARITYDDETAAAFKAVREVPRDGLGHWRDAIRRHLNPMPGMIVVDVGAGTGAFAAAFNDLPDQPRPVPRSGGHLPPRRFTDAYPHRGGVPPRQRTTPPGRTGRRKDTQPGTPNFMA